MTAAAGSSLQVPGVGRRRRFAAAARRRSVVVRWKSNTTVEGDQVLLKFSIAKLENQFCKTLLMPPDR